MGLRLSDLAALSEMDQIDALDKLSIRPSPFHARIRRYELRYEMSSAEMRQKIAAGQMKETAEVADWLFWLSSQPDHVSR